MRPRHRRLSLLLLLAVLATTSTLAGVPGGWTRTAVAMPAPLPDAAGSDGSPAPRTRPGADARARGTAGRTREVDARGQWPLQPRPPIEEYFDPPAVRWGSGHRGADLRGRAGQPVRSALGGRVSFVGRIAGVPIVVVDHGSTRTTYQPVTATVGRGDRVAAGGVIGRLQRFGSHCSPAACLHWGWRRGETYLDPLVLVGAAPRPVRLLPL